MIQGFAFVILQRGGLFFRIVREEISLKSLETLVNKVLSMAENATKQ